MHGRLYPLYTGDATFLPPFCDHKTGQVALERREEAEWLPWSLNGGTQDIGRTVACYRYATPVFYSTWPPSFSSLSNRVGERRWPQNKTGVVHRYQATVIGRPI